MPTAASYTPAQLRQIRDHLTRAANRLVAAKSILDTVGAPCEPDLEDLYDSLTATLGKAQEAETRFRQMEATR